jgi:hydroxymethylbilane synthase
MEGRCLMRKIVLGTRASQLALAQTEIVIGALLAAHPRLDVRVEHITTKGDLVRDRPIADIGDRQSFITEIEEALRDGRIDVAVHSAKDLAAETPFDMALLAFLARADPRDAVIARDGTRLADLPPGAVVGTGSARRCCQLLALRPDLVMADLRGNVDTRLRKLRNGEYDAIILARAGLERLKLGDLITETLAPERMIPAVGQGVLALEGRKDDDETAQLVAAIDEPATRSAIVAERAFLAQVGGGCHAPVAAYAEIAGDTLMLSGMIGATDGRLVRSMRSAPADSDLADLGRLLAKELLRSGGAKLLQEASAGYDD